MSGIRELSFDEVALVNGGSANGQDAGERSNYGNNKTGPRNTLARNAPKYIYGGQAVTNCGQGILGGAVAGGSSLTVIGFAGGVLGGAIAGGCFSSSANGNSKGSNAGSNKCGSNTTGTCRK